MAPDAPLKRRLSRHCLVSRFRSLLLKRFSIRRSQEKGAPMGAEHNIENLDAERLASLARQYYAVRFHNPERIGCPPSGVIVSVVKHRQAPEDALREHMF